jgi:hypothetical protein
MSERDFAFSKWCKAIESRLSLFNFPSSGTQGVLGTINNMSMLLSIVFQSFNFQMMTDRVIDQAIHSLAFMTFMDPLGSQTAGSLTIPYHSKYFNDDAYQTHFPKLPRLCDVKYFVDWS